MITHRERIILHLLKKNPGPVSRMRLGKLTFLISGRTKGYDFVPYNYGPFSFQMYHDMGRLERNGYICQDGDSAWLTRDDFPPIKEDVRKMVETINQRFADYGGKQLIDYIYNRFPAYTIFSKYDKRERYERDQKGVTTIGYEGKSVDGFLFSLIRNKVQAVVDVRKNAYSMKFGFSKGKLSEYLEKMGMEYIHMPELGIPSELRRELETDEDYDNLFREYKKGMNLREKWLLRIEDLGKQKKVALLCMEQDPRYCHRGVIADELRSRGLEVTDL